MVFSSKLYKNEKLVKQSHPDLTALISPKKQAKKVKKIKRQKTNQKPMGKIILATYLYY